MNLYVNFGLNHVKFIFHKFYGCNKTANTIPNRYQTVFSVQGLQHTGCMFLYTQYSNLVDTIIGNRVYN